MPRPGFHDYRVKMCDALQAVTGQHLQRIDLQRDLIERHQHPAKCPQCWDYRVPDRGHYGSPYCEHYSIASGGWRAHCTCEICD